jgi:hypothetical protein
LLVLSARGGDVIQLGFFGFQLAGQSLQLGQLGFQLLADLLLRLGDFARSRWV